MEFFRLLSLADSALALVPQNPAFDAERISYSHAHPSRVDDSILAEHERLNDLLWSDFCHATEKRVVFDRVSAQTAILIACVRTSQTPAIRKRLLAMLGSVLQLAGELFFDLSQYFESARTYSVAIAACKEAEEFDLLACALTRQAFVWIYERRFQDAADVLEIAAHAAKRGDSSLATRQWVGSTTAHAYAGLGKPWSAAPHSMSRTAFSISRAESETEAGYDSTARAFRKSVAPASYRSDTTAKPNAN